MSLNASSAMMGTMFATLMQMGLCGNPNPGPSPEGTEEVDAQPRQEPSKQRLAQESKDSDASGESANARWGCTILVCGNSCLSSQCCWYISPGGCSPNIESHLGAILELYVMIWRYWGSSLNSNYTWLENDHKLGSPRSQV